MPISSCCPGVRATTTACSNSITSGLTPSTNVRRPNTRTSPPSLKLKPPGLNWRTRKHLLRERYAEMRSSVAQRYRIPATTPPVPYCAPMDVDAVLAPQGDPMAAAEVTISAVDIIPTPAPQVTFVTEVAAPVHLGVTYVDDDEEGADNNDDPDDGTINDANIEDGAVNVPPSPVAPTPRPPASTSVPPTSLSFTAVRHFLVRHVYDEGNGPFHCYHLPIDAIAPHQPRRADIEDGVVLWLRLDSCLGWERDTLTFRMASPLNPNIFQRPAGKYTWKLRATIVHYYDDALCS